VEALQKVYKAPALLRELGAPITGTASAFGNPK